LRLYDGLLRSYGIADIDRRWLLAGLFLGTAYWPIAVKFKGVYSLAQLVAFTFVGAALYAARIKGNAWLAWVCLGIAVLSRQFSLATSPFVLFELIRRDDGHWLRRALGVAVPLGAALSAMLWLNYARFGNPLDTGYGSMTVSGYLAERMADHGTFSLAYVPFNLVQMFLQGFHVVFEGDTMRTLSSPDPFGTSIAFASPFLGAAVLSAVDRKRRAVAWA
jgi:hypothetical protein